MHKIVNEVFVRKRKRTKENCGFFFKNFHYFASFPSQALGCHWLYRNLPANRIDSHCHESFENLLQRYVGKGWVAVDNEKPVFLVFS